MMLSPFSAGKNKDVSDSDIMLYFQSMRKPDGNEAPWQFLTSQETGKVKYLLRKKLFPPAHVLQEEFPVLKKLPVLLPFVWIFRIFDVILHRIRRIPQILSILKISQEESAYADRILSEFGLNKKSWIK